MRGLAKKRVFKPRSTLTSRELMIACAVAEGKSNTEIATEMGIKRGTVEAHLQNIYHKLQLHSRVQLTRWILISNTDIHVIIPT
jgi:DNA-binding NarL/FixJ family response regulator